jgi:hypothetical protein
MQVIRTAALLGAALSVFAPAAYASEFAERLAAWQGGPARSSVQQASYQDVASPEMAPVPAEEFVPAEELAPASHWQQMAFGRAHPAGPVDGTAYYEGGPAPYGGCASCGDCGPACGDGCCIPTLWWSRFEVLLWWRQGRDLPPLVTSDPISEDSTTAGILPAAEILFGDDREHSQMQAGGRLDIGFWFDGRHCHGIGNRFYGLGKDSGGFHIDTLDNPVLAIPFFNFDADQNEALLVSYPGLRSGEIDIDATSEVFGNDLYLRLLLCRDCDSRLDFITGYSFARLNDNLRIRSQAVLTANQGNIPLGTEIATDDRFDTRNEFHGALLGLLWERECCCWTYQALVRMAIGNVNQKAIIDGSTVIAVPDEDPLVSAGGVFTAESNIGTRSNNEFTAITEVGLTLGYRVAACTQLTVGYSLIYWNDVQRSGELIDPSDGTGEDDVIHPRFHFDRSAFWAQGINLGLVCEF